MEILETSEKYLSDLSTPVASDANRHYAREVKNDTPLKGYQRSFLVRLAHKLKPVVMIGRGGFSDQVRSALDRELDLRELVKVKFQDYKEEKREIAAEAAMAVDAVLVRVIGNIAIMYRPHEDPEERTIFLPGEHAGQ